MLNKHITISLSPTAENVFSALLFIFSAIVFYHIDRPTLCKPYKSKSHIRHSEF